MHMINCTFLWKLLSQNHWLLVAGLQGSDQDREDLQARLRSAESRAEELAESLREASSNLDQYRAMAQSLEESLDKEKQVQKLITIVPALDELSCGFYKNNWRIYFKNMWDKLRRVNV